MDRLEDFVGHEDQEVRQVAAQLIELRQQVNAGALTEEQMKELADDLLELEEVRKQATDLDRKIKLLQAFNALRALVGVLSK